MENTYNNNNNNNSNNNLNKKDPDNDPPYSRLFIVGGKSITEEILRKKFELFGNIEYCRLLRDRNTRESKGLCYVKYDKASSAALAIENLNTKQLEEDNVPLKVIIAEAKGATRTKVDSKEPEDLPPRSRLFVICPKDLVYEEIQTRFMQFGSDQLEYVKLIKDRNNNESKGYAFIKFKTASLAALAMEEINETDEIAGKKVKVLIADPKSKRPFEQQRERGNINPEMVVDPRLASYQMSLLTRQPVPIPYTTYAEMAGIPYPLHTFPIVQNSVSRQRLFVVCSKSIAQEQLARMFSRFPGMEYCDLKKNKNSGDSKGFAFVNYSTPQAAVVAKDQMDGYEFPAGSGSRLKVMFAELLGVKSGSNTENANPMMPYSPLTYTPPAPAVTTISNNSPKNNDASTPSPDRHYPEGSRLFIVLNKGPLPEYILQEVFSRYGSLEYVRLQKDKNYGYAKYTTAQAAQYALQQLNGQDIYGQRLKVTLANPPGDSRKRRD